MTDEDVVRRAALVLETGCHRHPPRMPHHKEVFTLRVRGRRAVEVMTALHPLMGSRRQGQIEAALSARSLNTCRIPYDTEVSEMVAAKAAGASRHELAAKYGVTAKAVDKLVRGAERSLDGIFERTERIAAIEELLTGGARGDCNWAWLAGLAEGEAWFGLAGTFQIRMADRDVVSRAAEIIGGKVLYRAAELQGWRPLWKTVINGPRGREVAGRLLPLMGVRRQERIRAMATARSSRVPPARLARNQEIARRLAAGERGPVLAVEYGMSHQNIYYIGKKYNNAAACPSG